MQYDILKASAVVVTVGLLTALPAAATPFFFSTGNPDGKIATATLNRCVFMATEVMSFHPR